MRYQGGWVKINRAITDIDPDLYGIYFLLSAWALIRDSDLAKAGQVVTSTGELSEKLQIHPKTVRKYLRRLEQSGVIQQQIINGKGQIITVQPRHFGDHHLGTFKPSTSSPNSPGDLGTLETPYIRSKKERIKEEREGKTLSLELKKFIDRYQELYTQAYLFKSGLKPSDIELAEDVIRMVGFEAAYESLPYYFNSKRQFYVDQRNSLRVFWTDIDVFTSKWARDRVKFNE